MTKKQKQITCGIYKITNVINLKSYVGQSTNVEKRKESHFRDLRANRHHNPHLQKSFNKHGQSSFKFEVLEQVSVNQLSERETHWINHLNTLNPNFGFNVLSPMDTYRRGVEIETANKTLYNFTHLDGTREVGLTVIDLATKYQIPDPTTIHRMVRGMHEVACGWFINEPTKPEYRYIEMWNKDGRYIKQRRCLLGELYPEFEGVCFREHKPQNRIGDWFLSKPLRDKRVKSVIHADGRIIKNIYQSEFVKIADVALATANKFWTGNHKTVKGWKLHE